MSAPNPRTEAASGHHRIGKYDVLGKLGEGATSSVYLGHDTFANRDVAIKAVTQSALKDAASANVTHHLFLREGEPGDFFCILVSGDAKVLRKKRLLSGT